MSYKRIMLKLSGEVFSGKHNFGIDHPTLAHVAKQITAVTKVAQVVVVVGGGNIWRYRDTKDSGIERTVSDAMGMLATIMNSVALQSALEFAGTHTRVLSAIDIPQLAEPFIKRKAQRHLEKGRVVICAGGTGNPYFTTDTAAALRAIETGAEVILKATRVDGVFSGDPLQDSSATFFPEISYLEILNRGLKVMDSAAISLCMDNRLPLVIFNAGTEGNLLRVVRGEAVGTRVGGR